MKVKTANVSVIIPCYRCKDSIGRAINSILQQTLLPYEVILVDDASHDGTLEVLHEIAKKYPDWIKVIEQKINTGAAGARNKGWSATVQPYIAFLDADDSWHPDKISIQYKYMHDNELVAISGHHCIVISDSSAYVKIPSLFGVKTIKPISLIFKSCFSTPTVMLRREVPFRFAENKRFSEDFYLWQQIALSGLLVARIELPLAYVHKKLYGESGLSAQLWEMEKGELDNFVRLYKSKKLTWSLFIGACFFSFFKFLKRVFFTFLSKQKFWFLK
ncbi:glycosyltransferase family 2 protein [Polaromonas sp.]|uniref:glycosyltransferase family 2 protein n=1 Tax=Polaromonas sp. TaxID=1869339 RepID=UPI003BB77DF0